jgi:ribosomal protein S18 acetylase RimI-like enzyme
MNITIRKMCEEDILQAANVHRIAFPRQTFSKEWVECALRSFPMSQCFIAALDDKIVGWVMWTEKSGFRKEAFVELAQGAVDPDLQGNGICTKLVLESLKMVASKIAERGAVLKNVIVNTRVDNEYALRICKNVLGAEEVARVPGVFTADEVYLLARDMDHLIENRKVLSAEHSESR